MRCPYGPTIPAFIGLRHRFCASRQGTAHLEDSARTIDRSVRQDWVPVGWHPFEGEDPVAFRGCDFVRRGADAALQMLGKFYAAVRGDRHKDHSPLRALPSHDPGRLRGRVARVLGLRSRPPTADVVPGCRRR